ncbi:hypothetical protein [Piscibacillus halophilus]|uniref:Yip1 domain-containing protein n=1 Tax=Piscibacillus halophilus TaxID=571933 RepID=A0A1H9HM70_9BACI|nr:hypothetical protein [Piscibacillus halophilus]SEQ63415.1 hypothetical protein SAMN05216362_1205 [Piscibacillus halophilus]
MLICNHCQHQQDGGNFCENCGNSFTEQVHNSDEEVAATTSTNTTKGSQAENVKYHLKNYMDYFVTILKNPNVSLKQPDSSFINGIMTLIILSIAVSLGSYFLLNGIYKQAFGSFMAESSLPFFEVFFRFLITSILILLAGLASLTIIFKFGKVELTFKRILAQYGALSVPFTAISVLTILSGLIGAVGLTTTLLLASISAFIAIAPILLSFHHLSKNNSNQYVYLTLGSYFITAIIIYIMFRIFLSNTLEQFNGVI